MTGLVVRGGPLSETHVAFKTDVFPDAPVVVVVETAGRLFMPLVGVSVEVIGCNRMDRRGCDGFGKVLVDEVGGTGGVGILMVGEMYEKGGDRSAVW